MIDFDTVFGNQLLSYGQKPWVKLQKTFCCMPVEQPQTFISFKMELVILLSATLHLALYNIAPNILNQEDEFEAW